MIPEAFEYFTPASTQEAISLSQRFGNEARFLSGGHSLLPMMKLRLASPRQVIDLGGIRELTQISDQGDKIKIGALVTHDAITTNQALRNRCALLPQTASEIGDIQVRNRGTIGGSTAHADPAADYPAALLALDAEIEIEGASGRRRVPAGEFFLDLFTTALAAGELIVAVYVPALSRGAGTAYQKLRQQASGFAIVGAAAVVNKDETGRAQMIAVALNGVGPKAFRLTKVEEALRGKSLTEGNVTRACKDVAAGVDVQGDIHASTEYRAAMADVFARRAILAAAGIEK